MNNVLITGAARGLGLELVRAHLAEEFHVYALVREISREIQALSEENNRLHVFTCDISSTDSVKSVMVQISGKIEKLDRVFNNAGIFRFEDWVMLQQTDLDYIKEMVNTNAVGALRIVKEGMELLVEGTIIVNISSEAGSIGACSSKALYAYHMSKAAMNMGARIMDNDLHERGVRTVLIHPGRMKTGMGGTHSDIYPSEAAASLMKLLANISAIPREQQFMDYKGNPFAW
jgi:NAD(P)-dependent dehydrogenase (short-subunit alcohol dehydrogenase family)